MAGVLDGVHQHTQLAGHNRMELLMFRLGEERQRYGINVFKVKEVIQCPPLSQIPKSHPIVRGVANIRGRTIPVVDLGKAIGKGEIADTGHAFVIVTEYNNNVQGYLVRAVDRIVNMKWEEILPPPKGMGSECYMTAVTRVDDEFVEIIDVERVLQELVQTAPDLSLAPTEKDKLEVAGKLILVVDDSSVARHQIRRPLDQMGVAYVTAKDGREALDLLQAWAEREPERLRQLVLVISDIEMPEMDGYTLTAEIRKDPRLRHLFVLLHSSLSGVFNKAMVERVGANRFVAKYDPDLLAQVVLDRVGRGDATGTTPI